MIDAASHHKAVTCADSKGFLADRDRKPPIHHVNNLIVRVLMSGPGPAFLHTMFSQQQLVIECADASNQPLLRQGCNACALVDNKKISSQVLFAHLPSSKQEIMLPGQSPLPG